MHYIVGSKNIFQSKITKLRIGSIATVRSIKSKYELSLMRKAGKIHQHVLEDIGTDILVEGMSEAQLAAELFKILISEGHHGCNTFWYV